MTAAPMSWQSFPTVVSLLVLVGLGVVCLLLFVVVLAVLVRKRHGPALWVAGLIGLLLLAVPLALLLGGSYLALRPISPMGTGSPSVMVARNLSEQEHRTHVTVAEERAALASLSDPAAKADSTEAGASLVYPMNRPEWVEQPAMQRVGAQQFTVSSDPFANQSDALTQLEQQLHASIRRIAVDRIGDASAAERIALPASTSNELLEIDLAAFRQLDVPASEGSLIGNVFLEKVTFPAPLGEMYQAHAHVVVNDRLLRFIDAQWHAIKAHDRVIGVGAGAGGVVLALLLVSALLRIAPRVGGGNRRRLQSGTAAAILMLIGMCS